MVRHDQLFLAKWIDYYGSQIGVENLFVVLDGEDQTLPPNAAGVNIVVRPHYTLPRNPAMRHRAATTSTIAAGLLDRFGTAIATDVDEFIVVDPRLGTSLAAYLGQRKRVPTLSALGLDVVQHIDKESPLDFDRPILKQRSYAFVSGKYTKASIITEPLTWGSGWHRVKGHNYHIDPNLYLFHLGMADVAVAAQRAKDQNWDLAGRGPHYRRRTALLQLMAQSEPKDGDRYLSFARRMMVWWRPIHALNKPATLPGQPVVRIPERFSETV